MVEELRNDIEMNELHVSVIMVSYNTCSLTLDAIGSIYGSIKDPEFRFEIVVVDNASSDGSADAIEEKFPEVTLIRSKENIGFGRGNNLGAQHAQGHALFLLNTDTIARPGAMETLYQTLYSDSKRAGVGAYLENEDGSYQNSIILLPTLWRIFCVFFWLDRIPLRFFHGAFDTSSDPTIERELEAVHGAAFMVRRDVFEHVGGFDPDYFMYYEECDLCTRIGQHGYTFRFVPGAHIMHLVSRSSSARPWWFYYALRESRMIYARKHMKPVARLLVTFIVHSGYMLRIALYLVVGIIRPHLRRLGMNMLLSYIRNKTPFVQPTKQHT